MHKTRAYRGLSETGRSGGSPGVDSGVDAPDQAIGQRQPQCREQALLAKGEQYRVRGGVRDQRGARAVAPDQVVGHIVRTLRDDGSLTPARNMLVTPFVAAAFGGGLLDGGRAPGVGSRAVRVVATRFRGSG